MSKVKIQGNASGTGVVTLTAPNTNTDRTITLPDGDISLGVGIDDNATSTAITIDASENVGIGTTSPSTPLSWYSASANGLAIADASYSILALQDTDDTTYTSYLVQNGGNMDIYNRAAGVIKFSNNNAERMRIDSAGRVTMPYQPGFKAAWTSRSATGSGRILSTNASDTVTTGRDEYNTGSHFSTATGRFTAPVAGTYLLGFHGMRNGTNGSALECRIKKNGGYMWARAYQGVFDQAHQYWSIVTTTKCAAGDYFQVYIGPSTSIYNDDTYFYGHLLG